MRFLCLCSQRRITMMTSIRSLSWYQGQAMILGLSLMGVVLIALISMYSVGHLISDKTKQTHAVDAAAYSGALIQARALNMQAYINLAQIGHQMAMAHLVTLGSWAKWASTEAKSLSRSNPPAWVIATHFGAKHGAAYTQAARAYALQGIANQGNLLYQQFVKHDEIVEKVLSKVSYAIQQSMNKARDQAIEEVLRQNYVNHSIQKVGSLPLQAGKSRSLSWWVEETNKGRLTSLFRPRANYRSLIQDVAKVYHFLDERQHVAKSLLPVSERCPMWRHELRRQGSTILNAQGNWQSLDTQSYHALRSNRWIGCYYREYPMGWGWVPGQSTTVPQELVYAENPPGDFSSEDFWRWVKRTTKWNIFGGSDNPLANSRAISERHRWLGGGLAPYVDVINADRQSSLKFVLSVKQDELQTHSLLVKAAAETFFERPVARKDGLFEKANLWHPYWQARLSYLPGSVTPIW